jgi:isoleucyl-tRNA synthetase
VLYRCLVVTSQLLAPFCPVLADEMYRTLTGAASVHLTDWPRTVGPPDVELGAEMDAARRIVGLGRAARTDAGVRTRQPLRRALLLHPGVGLSEEVKAEVKAELNVRELEDVETLSDLITWTVVPNFLAAADGSEVRRALDSQGFVEIAGERLSADDVEVRADRHEDFALAQEGGWAVALDLELDDDLRSEGLARELVRDLNDLRKQRDLALSDRIALTVEAGPRVTVALASYGPWVAGQVLATDLVIGPAGDDAVDLDVDGEAVRVDLRLQEA